MGENSKGLMASLQRRRGTNKQVVIQQTLEWASRGATNKGVKKLVDMKIGRKVLFDNTEGGREKRDVRRTILCKGGFVEAEESQEYWQFWR